MAATADDAEIVRTTSLAAPRQTVVLVFDLLDTLVRDPVHDALPAFFGLSQAAFFAAVNHRLYMDFERGKVDAATLYAGLFLDGRAIDGAALEAHLQAAYRWTDGAEALLMALHAERRVRLCLLSNYATAWYARVDAALGLARFFRPQDVVLSGQTGHRKPEPAAYQAVLMAAQAPASACVLIDDREANCVAARAVGLRAVRFHSVAALGQADALGGLLPTTTTTAAAL